MLFHPNDGMVVDTGPEYSDAVLRDVIIDRLSRPLPAKIIIKQDQFTRRIPKNQPAIPAEGRAH